MMEMLPLTELWLSSLLAVGILFYLIYALLKPEDFFFFLRHYAICAVFSCIIVVRVAVW